MSLPALPPMRVPTLTEVLDWPPAELVALERPTPMTSDPLAEGEVAARIEDALELTTAEPLIESPGESPGEAPSEPAPMLTDVPPSATPAQQSVPTSPVDEAALTHRLLTDLQHQVDALLERQLSEAMRPVLDRIADTLAQQAREELASALRDMVALAVSREMIRLRATAPRSDSAEP